MEQVATTVRTLKPPKTLDTKGENYYLSKNIWKSNLIH